MSNAGKFIFAFALGAASGSLVAWRLLKSKYEQIAREEIASVKERYCIKKPDEEVSTEETVEETNESEKEPDGYSLLTNLYLSSDDRKEEGNTVRNPYVISPEEYDDLVDYKKASLNYYADDILTDEWDNVITNVEELVGEASLSRFGEYEDDSVFVRNDETKTCYEILRDTQTYAEAMGSEYPLDTEE